MRVKAQQTRTHDVDGDYDGLYADRPVDSKSRDNLCVGREAEQRLKNRDCPANIGTVGNYGMTF